MTAACSYAATTPPHLGSDQAKGDMDIGPPMLRRAAIAALPGT
jgi:hypothetical protein